MPDVFNILSLELPHGAETFRMTFEPKFPGPLTIEIRPAVVEAPVARPQNIPATIQQETVLQRVPVGSGSNAIVATYPVPKKIRVIDPYDPSATESESEPSTPQLFLKLLESVSKVQDTKESARRASSIRLTASSVALTRRNAMIHLLNLFKDKMKRRLK